MDALLRQDVPRRPCRCLTLLALVVSAGLNLSLTFTNPARADTLSGLADFRIGRFAEALQKWQAAADMGDARAALFVGVAYDTGQGVAPDEVMALQWYRRAGEAGSAAGAFNVAVMYDAGRGAGCGAGCGRAVLPDRARAAAWYARAAAQSYPRAEYNLAMLYESGEGVARSRRLAVQFYTRAAEHGVTAAREHLARLGVAALPARAATEDAAMRLFEQAQQVLLERGQTEAARAAELFRRAAEHHNALAAYDLGYCYEHGFGVARDPVAAYRWYREAIADTTDDAVRRIARSSANNLTGILSQAELRRADSPP